jgi:hypothetical protein
LGKKGADRGKICHYTFKSRWSCGTLSNDNGNPNKNCWRTAYPKKIVPMPKLGVRANFSLSGFSSGAYKTAYILNGLPQNISGAGLINGGFGDLVESHIPGFSGPHL